MTATPDDTLLTQARQIARAAHAGQVDKLGVDYFEHVRAVADAVAHLGTDHVITGLLHDTLEDCDDRTIVSPALLEARFGARIAHAVDAMTKRDGEDHERDYLPRILANPIARAVKRADVTHNLSRLHLLDPADQSRLRNKYDAVLKLLDQAP